MSLEELLKMKIDLCIIGSGPAGIIIALEFTLKNPDKRVIMVEFGNSDGSKKNHLDDSIEILNNTNLHDPYECTNKGVGGTSASWGGRCVMYDEIDFLDRPIIDNQCTWGKDILDDVKLHLPKAARYFECGDAIFNINEISEFKDVRIAEYFIEGIVTDSVVERWSMPTRFAKRYAKDLSERINLNILDGYEAREFAEPEKNNCIDFLTVRNVKSLESFKIHAKKYVVAAGAQEATRLLLRNKQIFNNLKAVPFSLGKYYQSHLSGKIASVHFMGNPDKTNFFFIRDSKGVYMRRRFQFSTDFLKEENLLNIALWLDNPLYHDSTHNNGAMSFMYLAMLIPSLGKKLAPPAIAYSITKGKKTNIKKHLRNIIKDFPFSVTIPASIFYKRYCKHRKLPGVFLYSPDNYYALHFHSEQVPFVSNRMEIGPDGETLVVHYTFTDADIDSVIKSHESLDQYLRKIKCGQLQYWYPKDKLKQMICDLSRDGIHQCGTTRIATSPEKGVVDYNLKVFGTSNLFICSSSVFPTSGQANPTFLLGAFAARLSNYLNELNENC